MGRDLAWVGHLEGVDAAWWDAIVRDDARAAWPLELSEEPLAGRTARAWIEALRGSAGDDAVRADGSTLTLRAWTTDDALREIGRGVLCALRLAGRFGGSGPIEIVAPDGSFGLRLTVGPRGRLRELAEHELDRALCSLPAPPASPPRARRRGGRRAAATPPATASAPPALDALVSMLSRGRRLDRAAREGLRAAFAEVERARDPAAIPALLGFIEHDDDDVAHAAANALLAHDREDALAPLSRHLSGRHRAAGVAACFKPDPRTAFDRLEPVLTSLLGIEGLERLPQTAENVCIYLGLASRLPREPAADRGSLFDFARFALPTRVVEEDPRWSDLLVSLSGIGDRALTIPRLLVSLGDPRAAEAYLRASAAVGLDRVEAQLLHDRPRGLRAPLRAAASEARFAAVADRLTTLATKLPA